MNAGTTLINKGSETGIGRQLRLAVCVIAGLVLVERGAGQDRENCLYCHGFPGLSRLDSDSNRVRIFYIDPGYVETLAGPHARLRCTDCHAREQVGVVPHQPVSPVDCTRQCHLQRPDSPARRFSHENIARMLEQSIHTRDVFAKLEFTGGPLLTQGQSNCLYCHDEPVFRRASDGAAWTNAHATDRCDACHVTQVPLDTTFALRHVESRLHPARPTLEVAQVCSVCHSDPKILAAQEKTDPVASYVRSFHGKAALLGDQTTAGCVDCHVRTGSNVHLMLGPERAESAVNAAHIADSCRNCHSGADKRIAATAVHLDLPTSRGTIDFVIAMLFIVITVISFVPSALLVLLDLAQIVAGRHVRASAALQAMTQAIRNHPEGPRRLRRFTGIQIVQHWVLATFFVMLVVTGFPMKFADAGWAAATIRMFGGLSNARTIHHWAGLALIFGIAIHMVGILRQVWRRWATRPADGGKTSLVRAFLSLPMVLQREDLRRIGQLFAYLLGFRRERPTFGRFSASEKFEYFGVLWGTSLLGLTGLMLWGEQITSHLFGGRAFNIAAIIHTYEAFLAMIHVGILHMYNVTLSPMVFPLSPATLTGRTPTTKLVEENGDFVVEVARDLGITTGQTPSAMEPGHA